MKEKEALLITVPDDVQASMAESLLNSYDIPVMRKYRNAGAYMEVYMGISRFGIDLYVPGKLLEKAQEIMKSTPQPDEEPGLQELAEATDQYESEYDKKRRRHTWIILLIFAIPFIVFAIMLLLYFAKLIKP